MRPGRAGAAGRKGIVTGKGNVVMMRRSNFVFLTAMAALAACSSSSSEPLNPDPEAAAVVAEMGQTFELRPGQTARVGTGGLVVGFRGVAADSRCAVDVTCVWSGDAELRLQVTVGRMAWTSLALHTHVEPRSGTFRDRTITVVALRPDNRSDREIPPGDYVVTLRVE